MEQQNLQAGKARQPSRLDWFSNRHLIERLYASHTLEYVREEMKQHHGFHASVKMYKDRIKEWNIDTNVKKPEMLAIIRSIGGRKATGKSSVVRVRGHKVPLTKIERSRKRLGEVNRYKLATQRSRTPPDIDIYTPPPSPLLAGPSHLETLQLFLHIREQYIRGSLECGIWVINESCVQISSTESWKLATDLEHKLQDVFFSGLRMLQASDNRSFGCMLSMCTRIFETLMNLNSPNTLTTLLNITFYALNSG